MSERTGKVQTVLGLIDPSELGSTQTHEHLLIDLTPQAKQDIPAAAQERFHEPIRLDNYGWIRRNWNSNLDNLRLNSESVAVSEMQRYRAAGGATIVDATSIGIGREPLGLARISRLSGVHIVMGAGYYVQPFHPQAVQTMSEQELSEQIARDITEGVDGSGIRSGIIGEIGLTWPVHPDEAKVLRAAAEAQRQTGAALLIHPGRDTQAPLDAMGVVASSGGDPTRTIMSHLDRTLFRLDAMLALAQTGCYLEFDLFGQESSYYPLAPIDMPNDAARIDYLLGLIEAGYLSRLVIAQDICKKVNLVAYGGEGYGHILENVVPLMHRKGMPDSAIETILVRNPADVLAFG